MTPDRPGFWWYRDRASPDPSIAHAVLDYSLDGPPDPGAPLIFYLVGNECPLRIEDLDGAEWLGPVEPPAPPDLAEALALLRKARIPISYDAKARAGAGEAGPALDSDIALLARIDALLARIDAPEEPPR